MNTGFSLFIRAENRANPHGKCGTYTPKKTIGYSKQTIDESKGPLLHT